MYRRREWGTFEVETDRDAGNIFRIVKGCTEIKHQRTRVYVVVPRLRNETFYVNFYKNENQMYKPIVKYLNNMYSGRERNQCEQKYSILQNNID